MPSAVVAETITLVADEWCPYNCEPGSDYPGYMVEIASAVYEAAGYKMEYLYVPWSRALKLVVEGEYSGVIAATPKEIPDGIFPEEELGYFSNVFIVRKNEKWRYKSINSLQSITLGVVQNYDYGDSLNTYILQNMEGSAVHVMAGDDVVERNLKMLLRNRIDAFLADRSVAQYRVKTMGITGGIGVGGQEGAISPLYIAFSPKTPNSERYAQLLSIGIRKMRKSGELSKILEKYGLVDWRQE